MEKDAKVLFVDDDLEILKSFRRGFRKFLNLDLAQSGEDGLKAITTNGPYAVVVSDYRMPVMDGIEFLHQVSRASPDTVRIMLTGQPDLDMAIKAVNEGQIFRFLTKPCPPERLLQTVEEGLRYYRLVLSERELLALKKWRKSLEELVRSFAALVESRDPYTAGHQQRVTHLACLIAREMDLEDSKVEAIRMAAMMHDVGKVYVPSEFLNRPGRLTAEEFSIIKAHPQVGFNVLKTVEFEHPISLIVQQHHESMDGQGYPLGLSGNEILPEARIITVADVVEAMNSHRPYRPSLGLDAALEEIKNNRGSRFDPNVVDACLALAGRDQSIFQVQV